MKLTKEQMNKYLDFLNEYKSYVGLSDWTVILNVELVKDSATARIIPDIFEHELDIYLSEQFLDKTPKLQCNVLFHELVHGKLEIHKEMLDEHVKIVEEHLVNDLVRGFEKALKDKWLN